MHRCNQVLRNYIYTTFKVSSTTNSFKYLVNIIDILTGQLLLYGCNTIVILSSKFVFVFHEQAYAIISRPQGVWQIPVEIQHIQFYGAAD